MKINQVKTGIAVLCALGALTACDRKKEQPAQTAPLMVYAAAGTAPAMREIGAAFTAKTGVPVVFNFANAGVLARQINAGGDADIFFSANSKWMDSVEQAGRIIPAARQILLQDELVLIVPKGKPVSVNFTEPKGLQEFAGKFATGDPSTPLGVYARQAFEKLGWWKPLQSGLCVGDTVNKVLNYVALGEADAGVVFHSVASSAAGKVDVIGIIPSGLHDPVLFPIAACTRKNPATAPFLEFIKGPEAEAAFKKHGWTLYKETP